MIYHKCLFNLTGQKTHESKPNITSNLLLRFTSNKTLEFSYQNIMLRKTADKNPSGLYVNSRHHEIADISEDISKVERIKEEEHETLPRNIQEQLELNVQKYSTEIKEEIRYLLIDLLKYPSTEQAEQHSWAHRLGYSDLKNIKNKRIGESMFAPSNKRPDHCKDCGFLIQESSLWEFPKVGVSTFKFFENIKLIAAFIFAMGIIYTIESLYLNIIEPTQTLSILNFPKKLAYSGKILYSSTSTILSLLLALDAWLLVLTVLIWSTMIYCIRGCRMKYERIVDQQNISAADFSLMIEHVPIHYGKERLQAEFNRYFDSLVYKHNIKNTWGEELKPFVIQKLTKAVPFALAQHEVMDEELEGLDRDILIKKKLFASWVIEMKENSRFSSSKSTRQKEYYNFEKMRQRRKNKLHEMEVRAREQYGIDKRGITTTMFATFAYNQNAAIIDDINPHTIASYIRYVISCFRSAHYFKIRDERTNEELNISVTRAPEPEDIIWGNIQVPLLTLILRKGLVWLALFALVGITYAIVYGITIVQMKSPTEMYLSVILALVITVMNMIIRFAARLLSHFQKDFTETSRQTSILLKSTLVCMVNWVFCPVFTNIYNDNYNIFGDQGLVYDIFFLAITNALLPPLIRIFDPSILVRKIIGCWKNRPYKKIILKQSELNDYLGNEEWNLGSSYCYFIDLFFFTCFYCPMHPSITITALLGCFSMYWAEKYNLLRRSQRPASSAAYLIKVVNTLEAMAPMVLTLGGLSWVNFITGDYSSLQFTAYMVLMGVSILYFIHPYVSFYNGCCLVPEEELLAYDDCRLKLSSEYDRLNPATAEEGITDYLNFLQDKRKEQEKMTILNKSEGNLLETYEINKMIEDISKIPNIFGKNNEITRKMDKEDHVPLSKLSRIKKEDLEVFMSPPAKDHLTEESFVKEDKPEINDKISHTETQKLVVLNYNSNGNTYSRKKRAQNRKTISVLEGSRDYQFMDEPKEKK